MSARTADVRKASTTPAVVPSTARLVEKAIPATIDSLQLNDWSGKVHIAADRASGISAPRWQAGVRTDLLERCLVLAAGYRAGPHRDRPETARRLLAHIDALAEAGATFEDVAAFAQEAELENPGTLWLFTMLAGCFDADGASLGPFEAWLGSLDGAVFASYAGVRETADALGTQPSPMLRACRERWLYDRSATKRAIALEATAPENLSDSDFATFMRDESPLVMASFERLVARARPDARRGFFASRSWLEVQEPALAYEVARARILRGDPEPLDLVRAGNDRTVSLLGERTLEILALAGDGRDGDVARDLAAALPTTSRLLDAMGRAGLPSLLTRLLAELASDEFDRDAGNALGTMLGPRGPRPTIRDWEEATTTVARNAASVRLRGGAPHSVTSILGEMKRPEHSADDLHIRADEVSIKTGRRVSIEWERFGESLESVGGVLAQSVS